MDEITLKALSKAIIEQAKEKGWGTEAHEISIPEKIALIHSEVSEAHSAYRKNQFEGKDGFHEELADVVIRVMHLCEILNIDLQSEIIKKIERNKGREWDWKSMNEKVE